MSDARKTKLVRHLCDFGYTVDESRFIYLVGTHSGYFFQKHYAEFLGIRANGRTSALIRKGLQREHIQQHSYVHGNYRLYHLCSKLVYEVLGEVNSPLRKWGGIERANAKLMITTFLVAMKDKCYLDTEAEKVEYFVGRKKIEQALLPHRVFMGRNKQKSVRFFAEGFPVFVENAGEPGEQVVFTYFVDGASTAQGFRTYLERYRVLFRELNGAYRVMYLAETERNFERARRDFELILSPEREKKELLQCFEVERMWEQSPSMEVNPESREFVGKVAASYPAGKYRFLYKQWQSTGKVGENTASEARSEVDTPVQELETCLVVI